MRSPKKSPLDTVPTGLPATTTVPEFDAGGVETSVGRSPAVRESDHDVASAGHVAAEGDRARRRPPGPSSPARPRTRSRDYRHTTGTAGARNGSTITPTDRRQPTLASPRRRPAPIRRSPPRQRIRPSQPDTIRHDRARRPPHVLADSGRRTSSGRERRRWARQPTPAAVRRERRCSTDLVWICETRLSVTPSTVPISARVSPSS